MPAQEKLDQLYMQVAREHAKMSKDIVKVGACLVTKQGVILPGWNGTPAGTSNVTRGNYVEQGKIVQKTRPEVIHAELNCVLKAAEIGVSIRDCTLYVTLSPCIVCAAMLVQTGVYRVVYEQEYRDVSGIDYLESYGTIVHKIGNNQ